jgi:tetratricopeptide (TPR) repeat protein
MKQFFIFCYFIIIISISYCNSLNDIIDKSIRFNDWKKAKIDLESYLDQNPTDPAAFSFYAEILSELNLNDDAIVAIQKAINYEQSNDKKGIYYYNLGYYYYIKNLKSTALQMFDKSLSLNKNVDADYYMMGVINYEDKNLDNALANWKKYVAQTANIDKKIKVEKIIAKFEEQALNDKLKQEEEKKKQEEFMKKLMQELTDEQKKSKSLDADKNKVKDKQDKLEEIE